MYVYSTDQGVVILWLFSQVVLGALKVLWLLSQVALAKVVISSG